jgi:hypothetical protein
VRRAVWTHGAPKFFKSLCQKTAADVVVTARTGAVSFNDRGSTMVESEVSVRAGIEMAEINRAQSTKNLSESYNSLEEHYYQTGKIQKFFDMVERMKIESNFPMNEHEFIVKKYQSVKSKLANLQMKAAKSLGKYGKFVYKRNPDGTVSVFRKYSESGDVEELYRGPF